MFLFFYEALLGFNRTCGQRHIRCRRQSLASTLKMPPKRMTANPIRPTRYFPGKAVGATEDSSDSESESEEEDGQTGQRTAVAPTKAAVPKFATKIDLKARELAAAEARAKAAQQARQATLPDEEGFVTASESSDEEGGGSEDEFDEDDDEESDSDSAAAPAAPRFVAPTFVSKAKRQAVETKDPSRTAADRAAEEDARRKAKADELLQAQLERDAAARAAGQRAWDDDDEGFGDDVDDTDGLDPEGEEAAWKLRELRRVKREREAIELAEKEREEVERRRNLTAEEREEEDKEFIARQKEEKQDKGKMGFMQKYFHKGAFFQGEGGEAEEEAKRRDIMGAKFQDDGGDRELLPQYMQIRDMSKLGKKGGTRYRDLKSEDTGRWGKEGDRRGPGGAPGRYGASEDAAGATGANASVVGERKRRDDDNYDARDEKRARYD